MTPLASDYRTAVFVSGHKSRDELKRELDLKPIKWLELSKMEPGKYWKTWTRKYKKEKPGRWKKHQNQRVKYGYSVYDWCNFDSYIAGVIAHALDRFASDGMGHPWNHSEQSWRELCLSISKPLSLWASDNRWKLSADDTTKLYEQVQEALHKFADNFGGFWD